LNLTTDRRGASRGISATVELYWFIASTIVTWPGLSLSCEGQWKGDRRRVWSLVFLYFGNWNQLSPRLWNKLPDSFRQPHQSCLDSPPHSLVSSGGARIFFLGGLGPFPPSFPFSSLPPFPLLSLPPSPPPPFPAPHRPVARIVKTRRQIGRVPLPSRTLPFPALTSPSLPSLYSPPSLPSPSLPSPSLPSRPFPSPPLRSRPP